jgi:hypothetical protein
VSTAPSDEVIEVAAALEKVEKVRAPLADETNRLRNLSAEASTKVWQRHVAEEFRKENAKQEAAARAVARAAARAQLGECLPDEETEEEELVVDFYVRKFMERSGVEIDAMASRFSPYINFWNYHNSGRHKPAPEWWLNRSELLAGGSNPLSKAPPTHQVVKKSKKRRKQKKKAKETRYDIALKAMAAKKTAEKEAAELEERLAREKEAKLAAELEAQALAEGREQARADFQAGVPLEKEAKSWWKRTKPGYMGATKFSMAKMRREDRSCYEEAERGPMHNIRGLR